MPVGIALFKDPYGNINYGPLMAATVISTGPMLVAYVISQKYMIRGHRAYGTQGVKEPQKEQRGRSAEA